MLMSKFLEEGNRVFSVKKKTEDSSSSSRESVRKMHKSDLPKNMWTLF